MYIFTNLPFTCWCTSNILIPILCPQVEKEGKAQKLALLRVPVLRDLLLVLLSHPTDFTVKCAMQLLKVCQQQNTQLYGQKKNMCVYCHMLKKN